jgi:hypothetical protein
MRSSSSSTVSSTRCSSERRRWPHDRARPADDATLKRLHLPTIRRLYADLAVHVGQEGMSHPTLLEILCAENIAHRAQTRITPSVRKARFPFLRSIEEFDFTYHTSVRLQLLGSLLGPEMVSERGAGAPRRGKTHLAVVLAYRANQNGSEPRFNAAVELIGELCATMQRGELEETLEPFAHPHVLVIDELGYQSTPPTQPLSRRQPAASETPIDHRHDEQTTGGVRVGAPWWRRGRGHCRPPLEPGSHYMLRGRSYRTRHLKGELGTAADHEAA